MIEINYDTFIIDQHYKDDDDDKKRREVGGLLIRARVTGRK